LTAVAYWDPTVMRMTMRKPMKTAERDSSVSHHCC
jgi:hypothetical protein